MQIRYLLAGLILTMMAFSVTAIERQFPANSKPGTASFATFPKIIINDQERRPAPGLRIWNKQHMIVFQSSLRDEGVVIRYTEDYLKLIDRIWILRPEEIAKQPPKKDSVTVNGTTP